MYLTIDYDKSKDKGIIQSDFLDNIREYFSEEDEKAGLKKKLFRNNNIPSRKYVITKAGRFELGMLPLIVNYLKSMGGKFNLIFSDDFKKRYQSKYLWCEKEIIELNVTLRGYQKEGLIKGLKFGNGIFLYPTASGKSLLMASLVHNVLINEPTTKTLIVTLSHLVGQLYTDFISYGIHPNDICKWTGNAEDKLNQSANIIICSPNILYSKLENIAKEIKKANIVKLTIEKKIKDSANLTKDQLEDYTKVITKLDKEIAKMIAKQPEIEQIQAWLGTIGLLLVDEIHSFKKTNEITNVLDFIKTRHKFGFTGTLPESKIDEWNIIGRFGNIVYDVSREFLVENDYITDVDIKILKIHYKDPDMEPTDLVLDEPDDIEEDTRLNAKYLAELEFLHNNSFRNSIIKKITESLDKNCLILVDRLAHGELLKQLLTIALPHKQVYFIKGEVEEADRDTIKALMETDDNVVAIAMSRIFSTGINIKNLHYIIFASAGKAKIGIIQSIGRGVRPLEGKHILVIFDFADNRQYGMRHLMKRKEIYINEKLKYSITDIYER